jgi:hypothetical protein
LKPAGFTNVHCGHGRAESGAADVGDDDATEGGGPTIGGADGLAPKAEGGAPPGPTGGAGGYAPGCGT